MMELACGVSVDKEEFEKHIIEEFIVKRKPHLFITYPKCDKPLEVIDFQRGFSKEEHLSEFNAVLDTIPKEDSLLDLKLPSFNYIFNDEGEIRNAANNDKFHFINQQHYDSLGDIVYKHIQKIMMEEYNFVEAFIPPEGEENTKIKCNIFHSEDFYENSDKLLVLIQGSGAVRAGQWARALCINHNLNIGSILPYIKKAKEEGYSVIVLNPNLNAVPKIENQIKPEDFLSREKPTQQGYRREDKIPGSENPLIHTLTVFDDYISKSPAKQIGIVGHSAGGPCIVTLLNERSDVILPRLKGIAFTDAVPHSPKSKEVELFLTENSINWITSKEPLDTPLEGKYGSIGGCPCVSAGTEAHEWTSGVAFTSVMTYLKEEFEN